MNETPQERAVRHHDAFTIVRWLAFVLANGRVYGADHKITRQSMADAAQALKVFLQRHGELEFSVIGEDFQIDDETLGSPIPSTIALAKCLAGLRVNTLTFQSGIADTEVLAFLKMLFIKEDEIRTEDGFAGLLSASGLTGIRSAAYAYRRVMDDETIISRADAAPAGLDASVVAAVRILMEGGGAGGAASALRQADLDSEGVIQELSRIAMPPDDADRLGPDELARQTIDRLERMSDGLLDAPGNRTQKGRRAIRKVIKTVEAEVADRLQRLGADIQAVEMLASRVKDLIEELAVDGLVAQYMKLRGEMEDKENKLKRHIKRAERRGADAGELKSRLVGLGLPVAIIENLSAGTHGELDGPAGMGGGAPAARADAAGPAADEAPTAGAPEAAGAPPPPEEAPAAAPETPLSDLLKELQETAPGDGRLPQLVGNLLAEMNKTLQQTATRAEVQMETLKRIVMIPAGRADNADLSRRQLLVLMAELGQELRQPLTVISGAVEMLLGHYFGAIANEQVPILEMAAESSRNLDELIGRMIRIAGMPTSLNPDEAILARIK